MDNSRSVPPVNLIPLSGNRQKTATKVASDLRWLGIDGFLKAKSLVPNTVLDVKYMADGCCKAFGQLFQFPLHLATALWP